MFGKFIITLIVVVLLAGGVFTVAATGLWQVPIVSDLLRTDKPINLGISNDAAFLDGWIKKYGLTVVGELGNCDNSCQISYQDIVEQRLIMSSEEISSYLNTLYAGGLPLSNIQIKLGAGNQAEASAWLDLSEFGYDISGPVYLQGTVELAGGQTVDLAVANAKLGLFPLPDKYFPQAEAELEKIFTNEAAKVVGYSLDSIDITDGQLNINGQLPTTIIIE